MARRVFYANFPGQTPIATGQSKVEAARALMLACVGHVQDGTLNPDDLDATPVQHVLNTLSSCLERQLQLRAADYRSGATLQLEDSTISDLGTAIAAVARLKEF